MRTHEVSSRAREPLDSGVGVPARPRVVLVGTYPPKRCGIATYTESLRASLAATDVGVDVVRVLQQGEDQIPTPEVVAAVRPEDPVSVTGASDLLSTYDAVILQHEFGIYGPDDGIAVLDLVERVVRPMVVTLHTVATNPTGRQLRILTEVVGRSSQVVVLSAEARDRLRDVFGIAGERIMVIPHGAEQLRPGRSDRGAGERPLVLTWGLMGPGKGLEWAVMAVGLLRDRYPEIRYVIAGGTHPKVTARQGEAYRRSIEDLIDRLELRSHVVMVDRYLHRSELLTLLGQASVVVLPYDSTVQTSSGVLVEAVTAGVPVVATGFPHAVELERLGAVRTVPHRDPPALAEAIDHVLGDAAMTERMLASQRRFAASSSWAEVGSRHRDIVLEVVSGHRQQEAVDQYRSRYHRLHQSEGVPH